MDWNFKLKEIHYYDVVNPQGYTIGKFEKWYKSPWVFKTYGDSFLNVEDLKEVAKKLEELNNATSV